MQSRYTRKNVVCQTWSSSEIQLLLETYALLRGDWEAIASYYFPTRSPNQLKCKFFYERKKIKEVKPDHDSLKLIVFDAI